MNARYFYLIPLLVFLLTGCRERPSSGEPILVYHNNFASEYVSDRNIEVWLPPYYNTNKEYDVIYIHDGQNVFNAHTAYAGVAWEMDSTMHVLINEGKIRPSIVVAIWNTPDRFAEYMPFAPRELLLSKKESLGIKEDPLSDSYLKFIVNELKPFIDKNYSTKKDAASTFIMGSSMGGLISLYAIMEYPEIFGGAACISTHWPALDGIFINHLPGNLPNPLTHRLYFDYGNLNLDSLYEPFQVKVDSILQLHGFVKGESFESKAFDGADHNEASWRDRLHIPLQFLLGKTQD